MTVFKRHISTVVSSVGAILCFVCGCYWDPFNLDTLSALPSFLFSIILLIIGQIIDIQTEVDKTSENTEILCETVRESLSITTMGTPKNAWKYIIDQLPLLDYVQNTSFNFQEEIERTKHRLYEDDIYVKSLKTIAKYVNKGLLWHDIGDDSALERFKGIEEFVSKESSDKYLYKLISGNEPQIGFILLTYKNGTKEVLFNWDFKDIPQDPTVLLSRNKDIFDLFAAQYNGLWRISTIPYDKMATKSTS